MHDPQTVAFEIKYPWRAYRKGTHEPSSFLATYRNSFITIWHVDPETDGSDDSCGWFAPKLSERDLAYVKELADWEEKHPYYFAQPVIHEERSYPAMDDEKRTDTYQCYRVSPGDCAALVADLFHKIRWQLDPKTRRWGLTSRLLSEAIALGTREADNFQSAFAFWEDEILQPRRRRDKIERTFANVVRNYHRLTRPWYRHPRWHVWHWSIQVHPALEFKRWAFTRCADCGGRFAWGETGWTNQWESDGAAWFRSESDFHHMNCGAHGSPAKQVPA